MAGDPGAAATGRVVALFVSPAAESPMERRDEVVAEAGRGLVGDRYHRAAGTWSGFRVPDALRAVTLFEEEVLDAVNGDGIPLTAGQTRRNIVVHGLRLNPLVDHEVAVGEVLLRGVNLADPCALLERASHPGVRQALTGRGGLRAEIVRGGTIRVGDPVAVVGAGQPAGA